MTEEVKEKKEEQKPKLSVYATLQKIDVKPYIKKKMGLDYLSWATAWGLVKSHYPDAKKEFTEYPEYIPSKGEWISTGRQVPYRLTPFGCEVEATVTINGEKTSQNLYVMDNRGNSVKAQALDMKLINKAQQRCLVKALATAGLGLEIYAGEDLPEEPAKKQTKSKDKPVKQKLEDYPITFNEQPTTMGILMKHFKEGNSAAVNYANSLGGEAQKVFEELLNSKAGNGN